MNQVVFNAWQMNLYAYNFKAIFILALTTGKLEASSARKNLCLERTRAKLEKVERHCLLK